MWFGKYHSATRRDVLSWLFFASSFGSLDVYGAIIGLGLGLVGSLDVYGVIGRLYDGDHRLLGNYFTNRVVILPRVTQLVDGYSTVIQRLFDDYSTGV